MADITTRFSGGQIIRHDGQVFAEITQTLFEPVWLARSGYLTGTSKGRNIAWFLRFEGRAMVLRHYWRGGMVGRIIKDRYWRASPEESRAFREYALLGWMRAQGLPVPRPLAARYHPAGPLSYRADLLMERIPDARPLADVLAIVPVSEALWHRIGVIIGQMHELGVNHSDLNCRNILLDRTDQPWLIDFDKCSRRPVGQWAQANINRLERSLGKEKHANPQLFWSQSNRDALHDGYRTITLHNT